MAVTKIVFNPFPPNMPYIRDLTHIRRRRRGRRLVKNVFLFTLEFHIYLELSSVSVGIKTCPCWICYECVQFQIEIRKIRFSRQRRIWSFRVAVLQRTAKKCTKNYNARAQPLFFSLNLLFGDVLVAVAIVFCVMSLILALSGRPLYTTCDVINLNVNR